MSVSHTSDVPLLAGGFITLSSIKEAAPSTKRRTKIICTLGPSSCTDSQLERLIVGGMTVARLNFSHEDQSVHEARLGRLRAAAKRCDQNVAVMVDTVGPEIRTGKFADGIKEVTLKKGETVTLTTNGSYLGNKEKLACTYQSLLKSVQPGQTIFVDEAKIVLEVTECDAQAGEVTCKVTAGATLGEYKQMHIPGAKIDLPTFSETDRKHVQWGVEHNVDYIAASFIQKPEDVYAVKEALGEAGQGIKVISKIENLEGVKNYEQILRVSDAIMIARGALGMELSPEKVFLAQKLMIREANIAGKPVITAKQMLESMIQNPRPTRAECSDIANAVIDGTDCVMLQAETSQGQNAAAAVEIMAKTCCEAENMVNHNLLYQSVRNSSLRRYGKMSAVESIASSAVKTAYDVNAKLIVVLSESGSTARMIAKFRPGMPVCVLTPSERVARQVFGIYKGCYAFVVNSLDDTNKLVKETTEEVYRAGVCKTGDPYVLVCGNTFGTGETNQIKVEFVTSSYWDTPADTASSTRGVGRDGEVTNSCVIS